MRKEAFKQLIRSCASTMHYQSMHIPSLLHISSPPLNNSIDRWRNAQQQHASFASMHQSPSSDFSNTLLHSSPHVIYRGRGIRIFRVLVRLKVFQLAGIAALAVPITTFFSTGTIGLMQGILATSLVVGSAAASWALYYYSRRYVGELSVLQRNPDAHDGSSTTVVRFSVLDFWGNRENVDVPIQRVVPSFKGLSQAALRHAASEPAFPIIVEGERQFIVSLRYGQVIDGHMLKRLLDGTAMVEK